MLKLVKYLFTSQKDASGQSIDQRIERLAAQSNTNVFTWFYNQDELFYENIETGRRVYTYELSKSVA